MKAIRAVGSWSKARHLCLVPSRRVGRAKYVREGRTLHVVDIENICGGPDQVRTSGKESAAAFSRAAGVAPGDHMLVACNPALLFHSRDRFPGARLVGAHGPDGADRALLGALTNVDWIAARFDRVVIGSGDHCFAPVVTALRARGIMVGVVAREGSISGSLRRAASFVRLLTSEVNLQEVA